MKVLLAIISLVTILLWVNRPKYVYLKLNDVVEKGKINTFYEEKFFSLGNDKTIVLTARSYVQNSGTGVVGIELNQGVLDSGDTLVSSSFNIQSQSITRVRKTKFGINELRIISWIENAETDGKFVVASLGVLRK